jgi:hypothetical protein
MAKEAARRCFGQHPTGDGHSNGSNTLLVSIERLNMALRVVQSNVGGNSPKAGRTALLRPGWAVLADHPRRRCQISRPDRSRQFPREGVVSEAPGLRPSSEETAAKGTEREPSSAGDGTEQITH